MHMEMQVGHAGEHPLSSSNFDKNYIDEISVKHTFHANPFSSSSVATYEQTDMKKLRGKFFQLFITNTPKICTSSNGIYIITPCVVFFHMSRQFLGPWYSWFLATYEDVVLSDKEEPKLNFKGIIFWNVIPHGLI